ncbi:MAG TPA: glycosyltransferase family 2 protein [Candidatus Methanofastidiosa archaeon]|nr:glycosyltransferase family 2 protein [Candidatus Methanofastidiosa archaeon]HPR42079.1 glycosyltransferase family 2 protein [Candidatus Methanofastidiosa archaeon]
MKVGVVLLTFNEIEGITALYDRLPKEYLPHTFCVDGGSTDGTVEFMDEHGIRIYGQSRNGRGEAFRIAFQETEYDGLVFFSPDGNEDPNDIDKLVKGLENGADMVIASRMAKGSKNEEDDSFFKVRKWFCQVLTFVANVRWNGGFILGRSEYITDTINGFRSLTKEAFNDCKIDADGYAIEHQLSIQFLKHHKKIVEIPTIEWPRIGGESYATPWHAGKQLFMLTIRELLRG